MNNHPLVGKPVFAKIKKLLQKNYVANCLIYVFLTLSFIFTGFSTFANIAAGLIFFALLSTNGRIFKYVFMIWGIISCLYSPVGYMYGYPSPLIFANFIDTDKTRAFEFLEYVPNSMIYLVIGMLIFYIVCVAAINANKNFGISILTKSWHKLMAAMLFVVFSLIGFTMNTNNYEDPDRYKYYSVGDGRIVYYSEYGNPVIGYLYNTYLCIASYKSEKQRLAKLREMPDTWKILDVHPKYKNYVLIIGESGRADFHNAYGFPLKNTPFLSSTNGLFIKHFISAGTFTGISIAPTIMQESYQQNNIISLAKKAGFKTWWISSHNMLGLNVDSFSLATGKADFANFINKTEQSLNYARDTKLLPYFQKALDYEYDGTKLIVLHLYGSHFNFCHRVDKVEFDWMNPMSSCYVQSIKETDSILRSVKDMLDKTKESYSMIYFPDHGVQQFNKKSKKDFTLIYGENDAATQETVWVPFVKISSDDTGRKMLDVYRSARNFLKGFCQWTGIKTKQYENSNYDFFAPISDSEIIVDTPERKNFKNMKHDPLVKPSDIK